MGMPELTFSMQKAANTVAERVSSGIVAMILRDTKANGVHTINRESDIPSGISAENVNAIKRAMLGYINKPETIYVSIIAADAEIGTGFRALSTYSYDYLVGPTDIAAKDATALAALVKEARVKRYIGKVILPDTTADCEGVINFVATNIKDGKATYTAAQYASRIAGILAGTPSDCSATYAALPEVTSVDQIAGPDAAIDAGKLILIDDGRQVKLGRAVTSKTTIGPNDSAILKKIKLVSALDLIRYHSIATVEDKYLGKCANTYDNKCILLSALKDFMAILESKNTLPPRSSLVELDASSIRKFLLDKASADGNTAEVERIKKLSDDMLRKENTGSHVFLHMAGKVMDSMEDFHIVFEAK